MSVLAIPDTAGDGRPRPNDRTTPSVSVVLPCLNEAGSVAMVVEQIIDAFTANAIDGEVIVADNGSTDGSGDLARAAGARVVDVAIRGYGSAIRGGIEAARGEICVMGDADATYPFELLGDLVEPIASGRADLVMGSRLSAATMKTMPFLHRYVGTPVITWLVRRAGGPSGIGDSQSGFRAFRRVDIDRLGLRSTGMEYASEMLVLAGRADWRVIEVDTGYRERVGESKLETFPDGLRHLTTIMLLAPDLAATIPGFMALLAGVLAIIWALIDPSIRQPGSVGWLASLFAPAFLVLGAQAVMVGLLLADRSPMAPRSIGPSSDNLPYRYLIGGIWAVSAGLIIIGSLALAQSLAYLPPFRGPQLELIASVLILLGGSAIATSLIARVLDEGLRRYAAPVDPVPSDPAPRSAELSQGTELATSARTARSRA